MILDYAVDNAYLTRNPATPRAGSRERLLPKVADSSGRSILDENELKALAEAAGDDRDLIVLLGTVGLRFNEACGLHGGDVDLRRGEIHVRRTLSDLNGVIIEQPPKNGKARTIPLPKFLKSHLSSRKIAAGNDGYLFTSANGGVIRHSNFSRRVWGPAMRRAGIEKSVTIHDLRGTAASWLIDQGVNIMEISRMLGHSDASVTLRKYGHLYDENMRRLGATIDQAGEAFA
jgi:integrase